MLLASSQAAGLFFFVGPGGERERHTVALLRVDDRLVFFGDIVAAAAAIMPPGLVYGGAAATWTGKTMISLLGCTQKIVRNTRHVRRPGYDALVREVRRCLETPGICGMLAGGGRERSWR